MAAFTSIDSMSLSTASISGIYSAGTFSHRPALSYIGTSVAESTFNISKEDFIEFIHNYYSNRNINSEELSTMLSEYDTILEYNLPMLKLVNENYSLFKSLYSLELLSMFTVQFLLKFSTNSSKLKLFLLGDDHV